ncbi:hypothetical protein [Pedobacter metabolipauper]|uniref:Uncharacterized protein n=1 Tax=Pedobacter metabolipauper TaxID=425513 RepID=A0A4R6SPG7_9SPHI|nr:hypothetical protein [Pedobacter metabolipauper]TDQ06471.1 hypothetical protein ATK78_4541 [Pedobacter metabolipauper]
MVRFRAFKATEDEEACYKFIDGHRKVLEIYGITMITSAKHQWVTHDNTYVILVESLEDGRALGGARIQIADEELKLPIEDAIGKIDVNIYKQLEERKKLKTGELCGLWNSREIAGFGVGSIFLIRASVALAYTLGLASLFALCAPATVRGGKKTGFDVNIELGNNGQFYYPKLDLIATAVVIDNLRTLEKAEPDIRELVFDLINNPQQIRKETGPKGEIDVMYDLKIT